MASFEAWCTPVQKIELCKNNINHLCVLGSVENHIQLHHMSTNSLPELEPLDRTKAFLAPFVTSETQRKGQLVSSQ